jgi:uncharacterized protein (DUF2062 family)
MKALFKKLLCIDDTPERTAFAFSIGIFIGFSPFLGFHTLGALAISFLFNLNRLAILVGVWFNTPWWLVPYYLFATKIGMLFLGYSIDWERMKEIFQIGMKIGFIHSYFWKSLASQGKLLLCFLIGSLCLSAILSLLAYPLCLKLIRYYRSKSNPKSLTT